MNIGNIIVPLFVLFIIFYGIYKKVNIYDSFINGAKEGFITIYKIAPAIIALSFAINVFTGSNILKLLNFNNPILTSILPMALLRPISGSASLIVMNDIFKNFGPDSYLGYLSSIIQGSTDTTIYVLALYFGSVKIKKTFHALYAGLFADFCGILSAFFITKLFFG